MSDSFDSVRDPQRGPGTELRLLEMAWKENLGSLATGLIHDFCNIMTGFISLSETLEAEAQGNQNLRNGLSLIRKTAFEAGQLAHRVRRLYQELPGEKNFVDLNETISNLTELLQKLLSRRITLQLSKAAGQLPLYADAIELQQVVAGLILGAVRVTRESGQIGIRTSRHLGGGEISNAPKSLPRAPIVCLTIEAPKPEVFQAAGDSAVDRILSDKPGLAVLQAQKFAEKHDAMLSFESGELSSAIHLWFPEAKLDEPQEHVE